MSERQKLSEVFFSLREKKDQLKKELSDVQEQLNDTERQLVVQMENENLKNFRDDRYGLVYLRDEIRASIEDMDQAFQWLRDHDLGDVIKETVHSKTLASLVKDQGEIPGVKTAYQTMIGYRKESHGEE